MFERLRRFLGSEPGAAGALADAGCRWVVIDVETSGLDQSADTLLAIGAVAVRAGRVLAGDSLELLVRPERTSSRDNILVHGIGQQAQQGGLEPEAACRELVRYVGDAPLVAFHASFDRSFLARATKSCLGRPLPNEWLDLAELAPAMHAGVKARALDDWLAHFGIAVDQRHHAASDALATAMLFLRLLAGVPAGERDPKSLRRLAAHARWVPR
ncbi:MAG TPA: 3'-5' exonuclease [Quisquiliibacterium sp.]|nr:3'-5' exonuclease [Quisquiliibacterium sp.]